MYFRAIQLLNESSQFRNSNNQSEARKDSIKTRLENLLAIIENGLSLDSSNDIKMTGGHRYATFTSHVLSQLYMQHSVQMAGVQFILTWIM